MVRFHIRAAENYFYDEGFEWVCCSNNNQILFYGIGWTKNFRNCVNHIRSITKHFRDGTHCIIVTKEADLLRRKNKEPLYGVKSGVII
jgi:hypothetical protein